MKKIDHIDDKIKILFSDCTGIIISLRISFTPSIKGWVDPFTPTQFGPHHHCAPDKIFHSNKVEYAIINNTGKIIKIPNNNFQISNKKLSCNSCKKYNSSMSGRNIFGLYQSILEILSSDKILIFKI